MSDLVGRSLYDCMKKIKIKTDKNDLNIAFFGTAPLALPVLEALHSAGYTPSLIVAGRDKIERGKKVPPPEKMWADTHHTRCLQPTALDSEFYSKLKAKSYKLFVVAYYGKILPKELLDMPKHGTLNVHPSLLPRLRGASPIRTTILRGDTEYGVTIMLMDEHVDHGPIIAQRKIRAPKGEFPPRSRVLEETLAREGGKLLAEIIPAWIGGDIEPQVQNHNIATYCEKIKKEDGLLSLSGNPELNLRKVRAYEGWPGTYVFFERGGKKIRVNILEAHIAQDGSFEIDRIIPEGKKEMGYAEFVRSGAIPLL